MSPLTRRIVCASLFLGAPGLCGQAPVQDLGVRTGRIAEPFSQAVSLAELPDGRVIVGDVRDRALMLVDFHDGSSRQLGRRGNGPGEYGSVGVLAITTGDSVRVADFSARRLLTISPSGVIVGTRPMELPMDALASQEAQPEHVARIVSGTRYVDRNAGLYHVISYFDSERRAILEEGLIVRVDPERGVTRVASLRLWYPDRSVKWRSPFMTGDVWAASADGRIARVVPTDYHVEWYRNDTLLARGRPVPYDRVPVTREERDAFRAARANRPTGGARISGPPASDPGAQPARSSGRAPAFPDEEFPRFKPPFVEEYVGDAARISPEGTLWVTRAAAFGETSRVIDVFDGTGQRVRQVRLPARRKLLGFGRGTVYLVETDEDGLEYLERYPVR